MVALMGEDQVDKSEVISGEIKVASKIVDYLSSGLYESPASCLKELVNNAYDANATRVEIFIKPDADRIIISDNGTGLTPKEFVRHFSLISESHKRDESESTESGRPKIGKIGIGFIAANEICNVMEIHSTKQGSSELLIVSINFDKMRLDVSERTDEDKKITKADYEGKVEEAPENDHYTIVFLKGIKDSVKEILASPNLSSSEIREGSLKAITLYGKSCESVEKVLQDTSIKSWDDFDLYSESILQVALNIPVSYHENWLPIPYKKLAKKFMDDTKELNFSVSIDGIELRKPIVFSPGETPAFVSQFSFEGEHVSANGYFYAQNRAIKPQNLNGILIRIRNAAIGTYDSTFLDFPSTIGYLYKKWISAEVWASDSLEKAMNIDRKTLRVAQAEYIELQEEIHKHLKGVIKSVGEEIYQKGRVERKYVNAKKAIEDLHKLSEIKSAAFDKGSAKKLITAWDKVDKSKVETLILKKYSVTEVYKAVIGVAEEVLTPDQAKRFIEALTKRLSE